ncbi:MAG: MotA/TolQ/ExbB proton channel family protein, partial [Xanthomonadales bacterium]|nr:MotA/TolQ/ExbB proton channel family protein [Xanthomonadales bacterium]
DLLQATFAQGSISLEAFGLDLANEPSFNEADDASRLQQLLQAGERVLAESSQIRREPGTFYLGDGSEVSGEIVRVGNIARYGISDAGTGALAPAGGGRFKLWRDEAAASARALAGQGNADVLRIFLYENANTAVSEPEVKTVASEVNKGGLVGYVIVTLGLIGLVLIVLRALFLANAGSSINKISAAAEPLLRQRRIDDAIAATKRFKGSAARVVTSALRNLERDRDHLEDIVSEAILHENTRLNRFGAIILMIAGVAPLLGLLGTVTGMIQTFAVITEFGTSDPKLLAGGIATALVTTELGLIVAIPCLLGGNLLGGWAERLKDDMEKAALSVINQYKDQPTLARAA